MNVQGHHVPQSRQNEVDACVLREVSREVVSTEIPGMCLLLGEAFTQHSRPLLSKALGCATKLWPLQEGTLHSSSRSETLRLSPTVQQIHYYFGQSSLVMEQLSSRSESLQPYNKGTNPFKWKLIWHEHLFNLHLFNCSRNDTESLKGASS